MGCQTKTHTYTQERKIGVLHARGASAIVLTKPAADTANAGTTPLVNATRLTP